MRRSNQRKRWLCLALCLCLACGMLAACGEGEDSSVSVSLPVLDIPARSAVSSVAESSAPSSASLPEVPAPAPPSSVSVAPASQPAPQFTGGTPSAANQGLAVTVTYKTDVPSTVNAIVTTSGAAVSTTQFYDYFNRGKALEGAVSKQQLYEVDSGGKGMTVAIPDASKTYYVLSNAAENETGTWQGTVTVTKIFEGGSVAPEITSINRTTDVDGKMNIAVQTNMPGTVYCVIYAPNTAPSAQQIRDGGAGFGGALLASGSPATNTDKAPYVAMMQFPFTGFQSGQTYYAFFTVQLGQGPLGAVYPFPFVV